MASLKTQNQWLWLKHKVFSMEWEEIRSNK